MTAIDRLTQLERDFDALRRERDRLIDEIYDLRRRDADATRRWVALEAQARDAALWRSQFEAEQKISEGLRRELRDARALWLEATE